MYALIRALNKQGMTVIMISHDLQAALRYATHVLHIGAEVFFGTQNAYRESGAGKRFGLNGDREVSGDA